MDLTTLSMIRAMSKDSGGSSNSDASLLQRIAALENSNTLIVNSVQQTSETTLTYDKTFSEIETAYLNGQNIIFAKRILMGDTP